MQVHLFVTSCIILHFLDILVALKKWVNFLSIQQDCMCKLTSYVHTPMYFCCQSSLLENSKRFPTADDTLLEVQPSQNFLYLEETGVTTLFDPAENMATQQFQYISHYKSGHYFSYKLHPMWQEGGVT